MRGQSRNQANREGTKVMLGSLHLLGGVGGRVKLTTSVLPMDPGMRTAGLCLTEEGVPSFSVRIFCLFSGAKHKTLVFSSSERTEPIEQAEGRGKGSPLRKPPPLQFSPDPGRLGAR